MDYSSAEDVAIPYVAGDLPPPRRRLSPMEVDSSRESPADRELARSVDAAGVYQTLSPIVSGEEAALDLAELEQLHLEAERMKGLGNRHMANQEYGRAYNAYSAALQLSPVGPSSHVYLSNRAAALLSLRRYSAAAVDARRAVALAPSFGKAQARLGQALYFLRDYRAAVSAYGEAIRHEPENQVTITYLGKARAKLAKEEDRQQRRERGEDVSTLGGAESVMSSPAASVVTDTNMKSAVVSGEVDWAGGLKSSGRAQAADAKIVRGETDSPPAEVRTVMMGPGGGGW